MQPVERSAALLLTNLMVARRCERTDVGYALGCSGWGFYVANAQDLKDFEDAFGDANLLGIGRSFDPASGLIEFPDFNR